MEMDQAMIVMPANNSAMFIGYLAGQYPGRLGHLYSPGGLRGPYDFMPFALDNGRFACWANGAIWDEATYLGMLDRVAESGHSPAWVLVPDHVGDRNNTLRDWDKYSTRLASTYGWPLAFAVQDGIETDDVPDNASVIFVGGSTEWKRRTLHDWCDNYPRVHIGRINTNKWLWECHDAGAESCDGTGWMRGCKVQLAGLVEYLETSTNGGLRQGRLHKRPRTCLACGYPINWTYAECPKCRGPASDKERRKS